MESQLQGATGLIVASGGIAGAARNHAPFDFNDAPKQDERKTDYDLEAITDALAASAMSWVPSLFPSGRRVDDVWVLGGIDGRRARKDGSCKINLRGPFAGCWWEHDDDTRGGAIDAVRQATGLEGRELFERCAQLAGVGGNEPLRHTRGYRNGAPVDRTHDVAFILQSAIPSTGTPLQSAYFPARKLPWIDCADLLFTADVAHHPTSRGYPAMIARLRNAAGDITGAIHRTYLQDDGAGKADVPKAKMMLGPVRSATLHLVPMGADGRLSTCEGIETGVAAHAIFGLPVWPALSTSGIINFEFPPGLKHLTLFADAGHAGQRVIEKLADRAKAAGIQFDAVTAIHGDDFADDHAKGAKAADYAPPAVESAPPVAEASNIVPLVAERVMHPQFVAPGGTIPKDFETLDTMARTLSRSSNAALIGELLTYLHGANLTPIPRRRVLDAIRQQTGMSIVTLEKACKAIDKEQRSKVSVAEPSSGDGLTWTARLLVTEQGLPAPCVENAMVALRGAPEWAGVLCFNELALAVTVCRALPWLGKGEVQEPEMRWADHLDVLTAGWLQRNGIMVSPLTAAQAVQTIARETCYHPVREYLDRLVWDGVPRCDEWLIKRCGAEDTLYSRSVAAAWLIQAVARAKRPGCKADVALILEGPQDIKKSGAAQVLGGAWFTDDLGKMGQKDTIMQAMGFWIVEIAELDGMDRAEMTTVKAFMTRQTDRFRPPYGRALIEAKRQFVFIGTVNPNGNGYIKDDTGGKRFWPIQCRGVTAEGHIDVEGLAEDRDQLWAEAAFRFDAGELWWLSGDAKTQAIEQQSGRLSDDDPWLDLIRTYVTWKKDIQINHVLSDCLHITPDKMGRPDQMRAARCLNQLGWTKVRVWKENQSHWIWNKPIVTA